MNEGVSKMINKNKERAMIEIETTNTPYHVKRRQLIPPMQPRLS